MSGAMRRLADGARPPTWSAREWMWRREAQMTRVGQRLRIGMLLPVVLTIVSGCAKSPGPTLPNIIAIPGLEPVAVYRFVDSRPQDRYTIGWSSFHGRSSQWFNYDALPKPIRVREPVDVTVTRAFATALRTRGFPVVDRSDTPFAPGHSPANGAIVVSGEVIRYRVETHTTVSGIATHFTDAAECRVVLRLYEPVDARAIWEKTYAAKGGGEGVRSPGALRSLAYVLARATNEAVNDPELMAVLNRKGH